MLKAHFPEYAILSEEEQDNLSRLENELCFVVDPLDGTKEFIKRNGEFTVNIALAHNQVSVMGVIYVPVTGELYFASEGAGAYLQMKEDEVKSLHVSDNIDISTLRVVMSSSHGCPQMDELLEKYHLTNFVKKGSSLKGCMIASRRGSEKISHHAQVPSGVRNPIRIPSSAPQNTSSGVCPRNSFSSFPA